MQETPLIPGTGDATAELHGHRSYHMGRKRWENGREIRGCNRNDENWKKSFTRKKAVWKRRKVEKFWGNARLVYRASFGGRSSLQVL